MNAHLPSFSVSKLHSWAAGNQLKTCPGEGRRCHSKECTRSSTDFHSSGEGEVWVQNGQHQTGVNWRGVKHQTG